MPIYPGLSKDKGQNGSKSIFLGILLPNCTGDQMFNHDSISSDSKNCKYNFVLELWEESKIQ